MHPKSALRKWGWFLSFRRRKSVDGAGRPIPWWTYSAIAFLSERLRPDLTVLEFGCGGSTVWLAERTASVTSVEDSPQWAEQVGALVPGNARVLLVESLEEFAVSGDPERHAFDILVIDAGNRMTCCRHSLRFLAPRGVVVWDNTDGRDWPQITEMLDHHGFRDVSFAGMIPQELCASRTTVFYRPGNCLGI